MVNVNQQTFMVAKVDFNVISIKTCVSCILLAFEVKHLIWHFFQSTILKVLRNSDEIASYWTYVLLLLYYLQVQFFILLMFEAHYNAFNTTTFFHFGIISKYALLSILKGSFLCPNPFEGFTLKYKLWRDEVVGDQKKKKLFLGTFIKSCWAL